jgi:uncharacterized LabA/DUF88 family protein
MSTEPAIKRAIVFVDGQNLFYAAKNAFGYAYPNYDIASLAAAVCQQHNWNLAQVRHVFSRPLRYRNQTVRLPSGQTHTFLVGQEKGVDVRLALDIVSCAYQDSYDVALVFSQDQDLSEVADELRLISQRQNRWIKMASAFPFSPASLNRRGINTSDWIRIDRATYDACLDKRDYRPKHKTT